MRATAASVASAGREGVPWGYDFSCLIGGGMSVLLRGFSGSVEMCYVWKYELVTSFGRYDEIPHVLMSLDSMTDECE
jgi:hypothetical protein